MANSLFTVIRENNEMGTQVLSSQFRNKVYWLELSNYNMATIGQIAVTTNEQLAMEWRDEISAQDVNGEWRIGVRQFQLEEQMHNLYFFRARNDQFEEIVFVFTAKDAFAAKDYGLSMIAEEYREGYAKRVHIVLICQTPNEVLCFEPI